MMTPWHSFAVDLLIFAASIWLACLTLWIWRMMDRVHDIENRDWPQKVTEWRTLPLTNCRCRLTPEKGKTS